METNRNQLCEHCHISEWAVKHHISYFPEIIIKLCKKCHNIIHKSKSPENDDLKKYDKDDSRFFYDYTRKGFVKEDRTRIHGKVRFLNMMSIRKTEKKAKKEAKKAETKKKAEAKKKASRPKKYWDGYSWRKYF